MAKGVRLRAKGFFTLRRAPWALRLHADLLLESDFINSKYPKNIFLNAIVSIRDEEKAGRTTKELGNRRSIKRGEKGI